MSVYFQYPISLHAFGSTWQERLEVISSYCAVEVGWGLYNQYGAESSRQMIADFLPEKRPSGGVNNKATNVAILLGMKTLNMINGVFDTISNQHSVANNFIEWTRGEFGNSPLVRMRGGFLWDTKHERMPYRLYSTIAAVYSVIGDAEEPKLITRDMIRARQLGYKRPSDLFDASGKITELGKQILSKRTDGSPPLSQDQVRYTLTEGENRGFYVRCQATSRHVFFSHRMTAKEMRAWFRRNHRTGQKSSHNRAYDAKLRAELQAREIRLESESDFSPQIPRNAPEPIPAPVPASVPAIIESLDTISLNKNSLMSASRSSDFDSEKAMEELRRAAE